MPGTTLEEIERTPRGTWKFARQAVVCGAELALVAAMALLFGGQRVQASESTIAGGPMIQRSMRVIPRRYVVTPSGATVPANETQKFDVVDANGNPVVVRWNLSGLGCYGATCGSIDEQGVYHPPATLPKPSIVTLEGVVVSDPHFSVLTQIKLQEASNPPSAEAAAVVPAKVAPGAIVTPASSKPSLEPAARAIPATPTVTSAEIVRGPAGVPLQAAVEAAPTVTGQRAPRASELPGTPTVVAAAPKVSIESARAGSPIPLPTAVAAPPQVVQQKSSSRPALTPLPAAVSNPPSVGSGGGKESRSKEMPLMLSLGAAPAAGNQKETRAKDAVVLPSAGKGQSAAGSSVAGASAANSSAASSSVAQHTQSATATPTAAPVVARSNAPQPVAAAQQSVVIHAPAPSSAQIASPEPARSSAPASPVVATLSAATPPAPTTRPPTGQITTTQVTTAQVTTSQPPTTQPPATQVTTMAALQTSAVNSGAQTLPGDAPKGNGESSQQQAQVRVTYRGGLLTIDARDVTLAEVLKAVATKTGATIDVPAGSGQERIVEHAGPGKPNDVMTQLLNGSHFNFILVNSQQHTDELAQVILSVQPADSGAVVAQAPPSTPLPVPNASTPATTAAIEPQRPLDYDLTQVPPDMSRDAMGDFMKDRFRQILERQKQQTPQQ